jgi:hypothetical protein
MWAVELVIISLLLIVAGCTNGTASGTGGGTTSGTGGTTPVAAATPKPIATFQIKGAVLPRDECPSGTVVLLFPGGYYQQTVNAKKGMDALASSGKVWPYDQIQKLVAQLQHDVEPVSGTTTNALGVFEFPKLVPPGKYLITVGIPTMRDVGHGQPLPKDWPSQLCGKQQVVLAGHEETVSARSAWFAEVKVEVVDRDVRLDKHDYITWPEQQPNANDLTAVQRKLQEIERKDKDARAAETQRAKAEEKARASGQPLHYEIAPVPSNGR